MKKATLKKLVALVAAGALATLALAGCAGGNANTASSGAQSNDDKTITVGASPTPHAEILAQIADKLSE